MALSGIFRRRARLSAALCVLLRIPLPEMTVPQVLGIDLALRRGMVYATVLIDARTGRRVDVLAMPHR